MRCFKSAAIAARKGRLQTRANVSMSCALLNPAIIAFKSPNHSQIAPLYRCIVETTRFIFRRSWIIDCSARLLPARRDGYFMMQFGLHRHDQSELLQF